MRTELVSHQGVLEDVVNQLFHEFSILKNARKQVNVLYPDTGSLLELDIWIPELNVAFEYQDLHHYTTSWEVNVTPDQIQQRDSVKQWLVHAQGWTLIAVPCWWDGGSDSLVATILFARPDLSKCLSPPTTTSYPTTASRPAASSFAPVSLCPMIDLQYYGVVPGIGELMLASFPNSLELSQLISSENPWWVGEKYDGVRFCWNYSERSLYSRTGVQISVPPALRTTMHAMLPAVMLDGEIWFGRGSYVESQRVLLFGSGGGGSGDNHDDDSYPTFHAHWHWLRMVVFDKVESRGYGSSGIGEEGNRGGDTFETRYCRLLASVPANHPFVVVAARAMCANKKQVKQMSLWIIDTGGEGVVMRKPGSLYEHGRNASLFKLKASRADMEALVMNVNTDGVELQLADGVNFEVPTENLIDISPKRGDVVSFSYDRYSRHAAPVDPVVYRIRADLTWEDVMRDHSRNATQALAFNDVTQRTFGHTSKPFGYWTSEKGKNMRAFMERFAKDNNFDPLVADNWYQYSRDSIANIQGSTSILSHHRGSFIKALQYLFPDIGLNESKFNILRKGFWQVGSQRALLEEFANQSQFDPLVAENWYSVTTDQFNSLKGAKTLLLYHKSLPAAIVHLFPEVNLVEHQFLSLQRDYWKVPDNQRKLFEHFARRHGMDPRLSSVWYDMPRDKIAYMKRKWKAVFLQYKSSYVRAAVALFPDLNLDSSKFKILQYSHWQEQNNRRKFFDRFARMNHFNPLIATNWYSVKRKQLTMLPGGKAVLSYHKKNLGNALIQLYPEVNFKKHKFLHIKHYNNTPKVRRRLFIDFATKKGFDPAVASNWYRVTRDEIVAFPGAQTVLRAYRGSVAVTLQALFPDIGLDPQKFSIVPHKYWQDVKNQRKFFVDYSHKKGFDALVASNWYSVSAQHVMNTKGASTVLRYYNGQLVAALCHVFPDVTFDHHSFVDSHVSAPIGRFQSITNGK